MQLLTFDERGISGHPNHISVHRGVMRVLIDRFIAGTPTVQRSTIARCQRAAHSRDMVSRPPPPAPGGPTASASLHAASPDAPVPELAVYTLDTMPKLRKFSSLFDAILSAAAAALPQHSEYIASACDRANLPVFVTQTSPAHSNAAMAAHASQYVWFRRLFVWFSRHSFMVTLTPAAFPPLGTELSDVTPTPTANERSASGSASNGSGGNGSSDSPRSKAAAAAVIRTDSNSNRKGIPIDAVAHLLPAWYVPSAGTATATGAATAAAVGAAAGLSTRASAATSGSGPQRASAAPIAAVPAGASASRAALTTNASASTQSANHTANAPVAATPAAAAAAAALPAPLARAAPTVPAPAAAARAAAAPSPAAAAPPPAAPAAAAAAVAEDSDEDLDPSPRARVRSRRGRLQA